jgi:hypothetical protein
MVQKSLVTGGDKLKANSHITCRAHAVSLPYRAAMGLDCVFPIWFTQCSRVWFTCHATTMPLLKWPLKAYDRPACVRFLPATTRSSTKVIRSIPIRQTVGLAARIFPSTARTFTKDTELSENGSDAAWHVWINTARRGRGTAWARHVI